MPATSKKVTVSNEHSFTLRFGSIAEIRHKQMADKILKRHGSSAAVKTAAATVIEKARAVKALRDRISKLKSEHDTKVNGK
jgi:hypothetical protein